MSTFLAKDLKLINHDAMRVMARMRDASVDLIVTDPPYRVISGGTNSKHTSGWKGSVLSKNDGKIFKHNAVKPTDYMRELYRVLKPGRDCYVMINGLNLRDLMNAAHESGFKFHNLLIWVKNTCTANRWYMKDTEYTLYLYKPPARTINNAGSKQTFHADNPRNKRHPTEKPLTLFRHYIENSSERGWLVFDPFMGCGTAAVAALQLRRRFVGCELDREAGYFQTAVERASRVVDRQTRRKRTTRAIPTTKVTNAKIPQAARRH